MIMKFAKGWLNYKSLEEAIEIERLKRQKKDLPHPYGEVVDKVLFDDKVYTEALDESSRYKPKRSKSLYEWLEGSS